MNTTNNNNTEKNLESPPPSNASPGGSADPQKPVADMELKTELTDRIQCLLLATFHRWWPNADLRTLNAILNDLGLIANIIAHGLIDQLAQNPAIDEQRWQLMVETATHCALEPLVRIARNKTFVAAVAESTAPAVAPQGSEWVVAAKARLQERFPELFCKITREKADRCWPNLLFHLKVMERAPRLPSSDTSPRPGQSPDACRRYGTQNGTGQSRILMMIEETLKGGDHHEQSQHEVEETPVLVRKTMAPAFRDKVRQANARNDHCAPPPPINPLDALRSELNELQAKVHRYVITDSDLTPSHPLADIWDSLNRTMPKLRDLIDHYEHSQQKAEVPPSGQR